MKKAIGILLSLALLVGTVPLTASAADTSIVIDKHGAKTYWGTAAAWGSTWNAANFTECTGKNVSNYGSVTVKSGEVKDITVTGSDSKVIVTSGTVNSIQSDGDVTLNGGSVKRDVQSDQKIILNGKVTVGGACTAQDITATGSTTAIVVGSLTGYHSITLGGTAVRTSAVNGGGTGTLDVKTYGFSLPPILDMGIVNITGNSTASGKIVAGTLSVPAKTELTANSTVEVGTLAGPGTLSFVSGRLTVHNSITGQPLFRFNNTVGNGTLAFQADWGRLTGNEMILYDYTLEKNTSGSYDSFIIRDTIKEGITLSSSSVAVDSKTSATLKAYANPAFSNFAAGTKIVWELHGDTTAFAISPDTANNACKVSSSKTGSYRATLTAYLVDQRGDRLVDYKSGSCVVTSGAADDGTGLYLDTSVVTMPVGGTYKVLAVTDSTTAPAQSSDNSAVAVVGAPTAYSSNGKIGWLYPVSAKAKGTASVDIGGKKMKVTVVGGSILVDTSSYTMSPGHKYSIGVKSSGIDRKKLNVHSANSCTTVQYGGSKNGLDLYRVEALKPGVGYVIFDIIGGQSVRTKINIANGAAQGGVSGRLTAVG